MLVYGLFATAILSHFYMLIIQLGIGSRFFLKIASTRINILVPVVLVLCVVGCLALNNQVFDVWTFFVFGMMGYLLDRCGYPLATIIIGLILGPIAETNLRQAISTNPNVSLFFTRPISLFFLSLMLFSIVFSIYQICRGREGLKGIVG